MLTALQIAVRTLVWTMIGLGLALVLVGVRLAAGPIELGWLKPRIEEALTPEDDRIVVTAGRTELRLNRDARTLGLVGVDVRYHVDDDGSASAHPFLAFPEVEVTLSVDALLSEGTIAASSVVAKAPSLVITRSEDGVIGIYSPSNHDERSSDVDFGAFLRRFALASDTGGRAGYLHHLKISGGRVAYYDRARASALTARDADLVLNRREGGVDGWVRADVRQGSAGPASVQLSGRIEPKADAIAFEADLADLMPADLPALWPLDGPVIPAAISGVRMPIRASIKGKIDLNGVLSPMDVDIRAVGGTIDLPSQLAEPLKIGEVELTGVVGGDLGSFEIEKAEIASRGARLSGSGSIVWRGDERTLALDLAATNVRAKDLPAFWPHRLGTDVRMWVLENIETGLVDRAEASLDLKPGDWGPEPLRAAAVQGAFTFEGLSVRYVDEMPPLEEASGRATFDADRMAFDVVSGSNAGLRLKGGSVTIIGMGKPGRLSTRLQVLADAEGSIEQALTVLDHPPLEVASELAISPSATAGSVRASLDVRMPLHDDVTEDDVIVLAEAELIDMAIDRLPKLGEGASLDEGAFDLVVDDKSVRLDGTARVNGVPMNIDVFEPSESENSRRRIRLAGSLSPEKLNDLGMAIDGLAGQFDFKATVTETSSTFWVDLEADLKPLAITPPGIVWQKPAGQEGVLHASVAIPIDGPIEVKQFDVETGDLRVAGALQLSPANDALQSLSLNAFRLAETDASIRLSPDQKGGYEVTVEAERVDLDALFGDDHEIGDRFQRFRVALRADQLRARGIELKDVQADAVRAPGGWRSASMIGALPSGGQLALELTPDGDDRLLELRSENAGALIEALDLGQRVEGGNVLLSARLKSQDPVAAEGRFEITGFVLQDAPLLARMLTLASLTGIGNLLGGEGIQMDHLILPFGLDDRKLTITDGLMRGSQLGLTAKGVVAMDDETFDLAGTIIPVYSLNRLIGQVPIIGRILTGTDGRGAFAATYSIKGPHANPTVYVNPLSILTPGLVRDLIGGLINGTLEPPEVRETDD